MTGAFSALLAASSSKTSSSGGSTFIIFLVLIAVVGYFLLIRPQKQRQRRQREQQSAIGVGDEVVTVGGIVGKVIALDSDRVTILSGGDTVGFPAVGNEPTRLVLVRNSISRRVDPLPPPDPAERDTADGAEPSYGGLAYGDGHVDGSDQIDGTGQAEGNGHVDAFGHTDGAGNSGLEGDSAEGAESEGTST